MTKTTATTALKLTVAFAFERATKNTNRYTEVPEDGKPPVIGALYVSKAAFSGVVPHTLTVTVEG